jgi:nucleoside-diphosphate-sugar epimerase
MASTAFITGIGGFIGLALAQRLQARGARVWGIDHDPRAIARAQDGGISAELCDVQRADALRAQMRDAELVIHTAAIVREHGELAQFRRVNVEGSRNVAEAARDAGAKTFVQLSSVMVYGFDYPDHVDEQGPLRGEGNPYCQTKIEAERAVLALNDPSGLGVIVIRPGDVYGPGSVPWIGRPLAMLKKRRLLLPGGGHGKINHVYVENLIDGILLALDQKSYGEAFNITDGVATSYRAYFGQLAQLAGLPPPLRVPTVVLRGLAGLMTRLRALGLTDDEVSSDTVRTLLRPHAYSIEKARRVLGYAPRVSLAQGLLLTLPYIERQLAQMS